MSYVEFERPCGLGLIVLENFILKKFSFLQISGGGKWGGKVNFRGGKSFPGGGKKKFSARFARRSYFTPP